MEDQPTPTKNIEKGPERFPTKEELDAKFVELLGGKKYSEGKETKLEVGTDGSVFRYDVELDSLWPLPQVC